MRRPDLAPLKPALDEAGAALVMLGHAAHTAAGILTAAGLDRIREVSRRRRRSQYANLLKSRLVGGVYDAGGMLPPGLSTIYNGTGRPEPVLTGQPR